MPAENSPSPTGRPVVTRFAPSPTGALHIGGARTALYAWAYAKKHHGRFILRIEDTDLKRSSPESTHGILRDLGWLGLWSDEGPKYPCAKHGCGCGKALGDPGYDPYDRERQLGSNGPYFQSQRAADGIYDTYVQLLLDAGKAYEDDGAVRFRMDKDIAFTDAVYGDIAVKAADLEDFVIRKGPGGRSEERGARVEGEEPSDVSGSIPDPRSSILMPTFHFAVVVDDALMEVTHVIRGQEHLTNTTKHAALYDTLAEVTGDTERWQRPVWVHTPSIMNPGGSKMSKRDKAKTSRKGAEDAKLEQCTGVEQAAFDAFMAGKNDDAGIAAAVAAALGIALPEIEVGDFLKAGYLQSALLNYIALLGWNPGDDIEHFDLDFLCEKFSLERIGKSNSTFDRVKLKDFNAKAIRELDAGKFVDRMTKYVEAYRPAWSASPIFADTAKWHAFCEAVQERTHVLPDPLDANAFLIEPDDAIAYDFSPKPIRKAMMGNEGQGVALLEEMLGAFADLPAEGFGAAAHAKINKLAEQSGINMGKYAQPVRIAVSGGPVTPPVDVTLDLLGKDAALARMRRCLDAAKAHLAAATN